MLYRVYSFSSQLRKDFLYGFQFQSSIKYKLLYFLGLPIQIVRRLLGKHGSSYIIMKGDYIIKNKYGYYIINEPSDMHFIIRPHYEEELIKYYKNIGEGYFIDIGANIGKYSILSSLLNKDLKIISIEANPIIANNYLLENVIKNNLKDKIKIVNIGVSNIIGNLKFHYNKEYLGSATFHGKAKDNEIIITVQTNTLDNILVKEKVSIKDIRFIKIDVEGFEKEVIKGAKNTLLNMKSGSRLIIEIIDKQNLEIIQKIINQGFIIEKKIGNDFIFVK